MKGLYSALLAGAFFLGPVFGQAQNADCFALKMGQATGQPGETVSVPVLAAGSLDDLISLQFALNWNPAHLQYAAPPLDYGANPLSLLGFEYNATQEGSLRFAWYDLFLSGVALAPGDTLFFVNLEIQPGAAGFLPIIVDVQAPGIPLEAGSLSQGIVPVGALDGGVRVGNGGGSPLSIESACQFAADCAAPYGSFELTLSGGTPPYSFSWLGPGGPLSGDESLIGSGAGQYAVTVSDAAGATATGAFTLQSDLTFLGIIPTELKQPTCQGGDGLIEVEAVNGVPPYEFIWSTGGLGTSQPGLSAGQYAVTVVDATGCSIAATFNLHETSGFYLWQFETPPHCGQTDGFVGVQPVGYSAPFQYLWNLGATTDELNGVGPGIYSVTVTNAEGCTETANFWLATQGANDNWVHNETFTCDTSGLADLAGIFWIAPGIAPPVSFTWSNGTTQVLDSVDAGGFFFELPDQPQGAHHVRVADAAGCETFVFFQADCAATSPDSLVSACLMLQTGPADGLPFSNKTCVAVTARGFDELTRLRFALEWPADKYLFTNLLGVALTPFEPLDLSVFEDQGALLIDWEDPSGAGLTLPGGDTLFRVCFQEIENPAPGTGLVFTDDFTPEAARAGGGPIAFAAFDGRFYGGFDTPDAVCSVSPDCQNDGAGGFLLGGAWWNANEQIQLFQHGALQWEGLTAGLSNLLPGAYRARFPAVNGQAPQEALFHLPLLTTADCVWPGDADNNAAANHHDLLYLGLAYGASGPARPAQSLDWAGQDGVAWSQRTGLRKINFQNIDTDGDGDVTVADTLAIVQNWGQVINPATDDPFDAPLGNQVLPLAPLLTIAVDTASAGQTIVLPVLLGSAAAPVDSLHGLAFSLTYDPAMLEAELWFQPAASWLGDPATELLWLQRNFPEQGRLDVALTRFDGLPAGGDGVIGHLYIIIEDDIFVQAPDGDPVAFPAQSDTIKFTPLHFGNLQALRPDERPRPLQTADVLLPIRPFGGASGTAEPADWAKALTLSPNPTSVELRLNSPHTGILEVELVAPTGQLLQNFPLAGQRQATLTLPPAPDGIYWVKIYTSQGVVVKKLLLVN